MRTAPYLLILSCVFVAAFMLTVALLNLAFAQPERSISFLVPTVAFGALAVVFHESAQRRP
jgi:hypothetical protein